MEANPYERLRSERIKRNNEELGRLGIGALVPAELRHATKKTPARLPRRERPPPLAPERASARLRNVPAPPPLELPDEEAEETEGAHKRRRGNVSATAGDGVAVFSTAAPSGAALPGAPAKAGSCRALNASVEAMQQQLGRLVLPSDGTGAMKAAALQALHGARRQISFNKYSGIQEWVNAVALFVNVKGCRDKYDNAFLDGGRRMTWFAQPTQTEATPVIQRLLASRGATSVNSLTDVVLFAREEGAAYVYCGLLAVDCHFPQSKPLKFVFKLVNADALLRPGSHFSGALVCLCDGPFLTPVFSSPACVVGEVT